MWSRFTEALVPFPPPSSRTRPSPDAHHSCLLGRRRRSGGGYRAWWRGGPGKHRTRSEQFTSRCGMCAYRLHCQCQIFGGLAIFYYRLNVHQKPGRSNMIRPCAPHRDNEKKKRYIFFPLNQLYQMRARHVRVARIAIKVHGMERHCGKFYFIRV